jgi:hypothetical protein
MMTILALAASAGATLPVPRFADAILRCQTTDGAITMGPGADRVVPYFGNLAAIGLVEAYRSTGDSRYQAAARRWVAWYEARMAANGVTTDYTGKPGAWVSTGKQDSTDSYAATWLELVDALTPPKPDAKTAKARMPGVKKAVAAIRLTMQPNGLTLAKPDWPVMYTMDNVEVWRGLKAAARLAKRCGSPGLAKEWQAMADRCAAAIASDLWDTGLASYYIGIQPDGGRMKGLAAWYPDVMANLMAIGWGPSSSRHATLYRRLKTDFAVTLPASVSSEDDLEHAVWWGFAAKASKDTAVLQSIRAAMAAFTGPVSNPATLGHAIRLVADGAQGPAAGL